MRERLGADPPVDYKTIIDTFGGGYVDGYLRVLDPGCVNAFYDFIAAAEERAEANEQLWGGGETELSELDEAGARLIPWASTDNEEFLYWLALPDQDPGEWTVVVNEARSSRWEHVDLTFPRFLVTVLTGEIRSEILSDPFPASPYDFQPSSRFV
ncbi:hypothetical protein [Kitasatospora sp. NPDC088783]|uniref:hypothetical protein n=1 Tax=Kitasatospora sp. NPDC088783 TaxID=3364077 RepID=UPI0037FE36D5